MLNQTAPVAVFLFVLRVYTIEKTMDDNQQPKQNEEVDFSNFYNQPTKNDNMTKSPTIPSKNGAFASKRIWIFLAILLILAAAQIFILVRNPKPGSNIPSGYHIVKPANGPIRVEKIK